MGSFSAEQEKKGIKQGVSTTPQGVLTVQRPQVAGPGAQAQGTLLQSASTQRSGHSKGWHDGHFYGFDYECLVSICLAYYP